MTATGVQWPDLASYLPALGGGGVAGVWIIAWLKRWIVSPREVEQAETERDEWKDLYMREREAHERTRDALRLASERGESTAEALQLVAGVMNAVRMQAGHEDHLLETQSARPAARRTKTSEGGDKQVHPSS
jgi:hypothetical protein